MEGPELELIGLALTLPSRSTTTRTKAWRALKSLGAAVLRDGVYVLPSDLRHEEQLRSVGKGIVSSGGTAELLVLRPHDEDQKERFLSMFDRGAEFGEIVSETQRLNREKALDPQVAERRIRVLRRRFDQCAAIDFFPSEAQDQARRALALCKSRLRGKWSPGEPQPLEGRIERLRKEDFQGRLWATRARPWVDRLASAWLIARHIDRNPRFLWLKDPGDRPASALGFDFDGAPFTHVGGRVTFETLSASFGLEDDPVLERIAALVHFLDVGGVPVPEGAGLEAVLTGLRDAVADDDLLLRDSNRIFDYLYLGFESST